MDKLHTSLGEPKTIAQIMADYEDKITNDKILVIIDKDAKGEDDVSILFRADLGGIAHQTHDERCAVVWPPQTYVVKGLYPLKVAVAMLYKKYQEPVEPKLAEIIQLRKLD